MIPENYSYIGLLLGIAGSLHYLILTLRGHVQPSRVTWLLWGLFPLIVYVTQIVNGVGVPALNTLAASVLPLLVVTASIRVKRSRWNTSPYDYLLALLATVGIVLSLYTGTALYAMLLAILADFFATVPTYYKSYFYPKSENVTVYIVGTLGAGISLMAVQAFVPVAVLFLIYLVFSNTTICLLLYAGSRRLVPTQNKAI